MKKVELSLDEWQRLAAITPKERERALKKLKRGGCITRSSIADLTWR